MDPITAVAAVTAALKIAEGLIAVYNSIHSGSSAADIRSASLAALDETIKELDAANEARILPESLVKHLDELKTYRNTLAAANTILGPAIDGLIERFRSAISTAQGIHNASFAKAIADQVADDPGIPINPGVNP